VVLFQWDQAGINCLSNGGDLRVELMSRISALIAAFELSRLLMVLWAR